MAVNIFLKEYKKDHREVIKCLKTFDSKKLGIDRLKMLQTLLPQDSEVSNFKISEYFSFLSFFILGFNCCLLQGRVATRVSGR